MVIKIIFLFFCTLYISTVFSQLNSSPVSEGFSRKVSLPEPKYHDQEFPNKVSIIDRSTGSTFTNSSVDVNGFPYFLPDWKYTLITLTDGRKIDMVKTRLNLCTKELYFKQNDNSELIFDTGYVKEMNIYNSPESKIIIATFKTGFPKIDNQNTNTYYQILTQGKTTLLKVQSKKLSVNKNDISGELLKQYDLRDDYYIFKNNQMKRLKKDQEFLMNTLSEKKVKLNEFIDQHPISFKNIEDIKSLISYYNSLFSQ